MYFIDEQQLAGYSGYGSVGMGRESHRGLPAGFLYQFLLLTFTKNQV
jgi:hypothetical protein